MPRFMRPVGRSIFLRQTGLPPLPECGSICITNQSILDSQRPGGCGFSNTACQCSSVAYLQPVYDCFVATCNATDLAASNTYGDAICASVGVLLSSGLVTQPGTSSSTSDITSALTNTGNAPATSTASSAGASPALSGVPLPTYPASTEMESSGVSPSYLPLSNQTTAESPNTGAIVGGSAAGVIAFAALLIALWLRRRRRQLRQSAIAVPFADGSSKTGLTPEVERAFHRNVKQPEAPRPVSDQTPVSGMGADEEEDEQQESLVSDDRTENTGLPPPAYETPAPNRRSTGGQRERAVVADTRDPFDPNRESLNDTADAMIYNTEMHQFCAANRDIISLMLERKLCAAHWLPTDDPGEMPAEHWRSTYGIEVFELKRVQEAYTRWRSARLNLNSMELQPSLIAGEAHGAETASRQSLNRATPG